MQKLSDLLESTRPGPGELAPPDVTELVRRARVRDRLRRGVVTGISVAGVGLAVMAGVALTGPGALFRPDVAGTPGQDATPARVGVWTQVESPLEPRRSAMVATSSDGRVVVFGGAAASGDGNANAWQSGGAIYDPQAGEWSAIPPAPVGGVPLASGRFGQAALAGDRLLVLAGDDGAMGGAVYDLADGAWTPVPVTRELGGYAEGVMWDGDTLALLQLGFRDGRADAPTLVRWQVGDDDWSTVTPPPVGARNNAAVSFGGGQLFVWGGSVATDTFEAGRPAPGATSDGVVYDVASDIWIPVPPAPLPAGTLGAATWLDDTHVAVITNDGTVEPGDTADGSHQVAVYDTAAETWARVDPAATGLDRPFFRFAGQEAPRGPAGGHGLLVAVDANRPQSFPVDPWSSQLRIYDPATGAWLAGPDGGSAHLVSIGGELAATTMAGGNPGDHPFEVAVRTADGWALAAEADMRNRMDAGVATDEGRLFLFGGMAGRDIELRGDLWILDLAPELIPGD